MRYKNILQRQPLRFASFSAIAALVATCGCGTDARFLILDALTVQGQTSLDLLLTDIAVTLDENLPEPPIDGGNNGGGVDSGAGDALADPVASLGEEFFNNNGCTGCHCDDASGGCALDAPVLVGAVFETLNRQLRQSGGHFSAPPDISDQQLANLEAFLASL